MTFFPPLCCPRLKGSEPLWCATWRHSMRFFRSISGRFERIVVVRRFSVDNARTTPAHWMPLFRLAPRCFERIVVVRRLSTLLALCVSSLCQLLPSCRLSKLLSPLSLSLSLSLSSTSSGKKPKIITQYNGQNFCFFLLFCLYFAPKRSELLVNFKVFHIQTSHTIIPTNYQSNIDCLRARLTRPRTHRLATQHNHYTSNKEK